MEEQFDKEIHALAPMKEVEWLLDYMFGFAGEVGECPKNSCIHDCSANHIRMQGFVSRYSTVETSCKSIGNVVFPICEDVVL